jgi:hypothetical protein
MILVPIRKVKHFYTAEDGDVHNIRRDMEAQEQQARSRLDHFLRTFVGLSTLVHYHHLASEFRRAVQPD